MIFFQCLLSFLRSFRCLNGCSGSEICGCVALGLILRIPQACWERKVEFFGTRNVRALRFVFFLFGDSSYCEKIYDRSFECLERVFKNSRNYRILCVRVNWKDGSFLIIKYTRNFQAWHFSENLVVERRNFILLSRLTLVQNVIFWVEVPLIQKCIYIYKNRNKRNALQSNL